MTQNKNNNEGVINIGDVQYKLIKVEQNIQEELKEEPTEGWNIWRAPMNEEYYTPNIAAGEVYFDHYPDQHDNTDNIAYSKGLYFRTKQQTQKYKEWFEFICEYNMFVYNLQGNWSPKLHDECFSISRNTKDKNWDIDVVHIFYQDMCPIYRTRQIAEAVINKFVDKLLMLDPHWVIQNCYNIERYEQKEVKLLTAEDIGNWFVYKPYRENEKGKLKKFDNKRKIAFIVFHCNDDSNFDNDMWLNYTATSVDYKDLFYINNIV